MRKRFENLKFTIVSILTLALLGAFSYWAFSSIESGSSHIESQKQKEMEQKIVDLTDENYQLKRQLGLLEELKKEDPLVGIETKNQEVDKTKDIPAKPVEPIKPKAPTTDTSSKSYKYQSLIDEIQGLVNKLTYLKAKSQGPAVGTVQKFLNLYNNTNNKIDNDYGPVTVTAIKIFQKAQGLTDDGEAGVDTFKKMVSWLKTK